MPNAARRQPEPTVDPLVRVQTRADALYRGAVECCRQHDRSARLSSTTDEPELEHKHIEALCRMCDQSLQELAEAYHEVAGSVHPERDEAWWHKANSLWHASREYVRRHAGCDDISRKVSSKHGASVLGAAQVEYELEASSLLALRHAADAYRKTRPQLGQRAGAAVRSFVDASGARWHVTIGKESWGTLVLLFSPAGAGAARTTILHAETAFDANVELEALTDDELRARLSDSRPWQ